ncbi:MAG: HAMP domain-containing sensor histidine kinase [Actinomycetota bacterium]|nr:HAMP domain-containing sensor histidine kinase [Actinomycetota bacterium]
MRRRLILVTAAVTTMVVIAFLVPLAILVRDLAADRALTGVERDAESIARLVTVLVPDRGFDGAVEALGADRLMTIGASVALVDGSVVGAPVPEGEDLSTAFAGSAFRARVEGGQAVYVPVVAPDGSIAVVRVLAPGDEITRGVARSWIILGALGALLVGLAVLVTDRLGRSIVVPVKELSTTASKLGEGDLSVRVEPSGPPEIEEVGAEFNRLAERVTRLLQQERETAADLSHRLRTPLTAARLDVEALDDAEARDLLLGDLDEVERSVDFIIREARRPVRTETGEECDLGSVTAERVAFWSVLAEEQDRAVVIQVIDEPVRVAIPGGDAEAMIDALIENVFSHSGDGAPIAVSIVRKEGEAVVTVEDGGHGFPDRDVLERGRSNGSSTGLGLDIVRRTAEMSGGEMEIGRSTDLGGARVVVKIPLRDVGERSSR